MLDKGQIRRNIKGMAKRMLKGSWGVALGVLIIPILLSFGFAALRLAVAAMLDIDQGLLTQGFPYAIPSARLTSYSLVNTILGIAQLALSIPIGFGVTSWFVSLTDGHRAPLSAAFRFLDSAQRYWKTVTVSLLLFLRSFLYSLLFLVAPIGVTIWLAVELSGGMLADYFYRYGRYGFHYGTDTPFYFYGDGGRAAGMFLLAALAILVASVALTVFLARYLPVTYLTIRNPRRPAREILGESVRIMKGHKLEATWFVLSFLGWAILSALLWVPMAALLNLLLPWDATLTAFPFLVSLPTLFLSVYFESCTVLFCEYVEDSARLREGHAPYTVVEEEPRHTWSAESERGDALPGDTTPITSMQEELWRRMPREGGTPATAPFDTKELWRVTDQSPDSAPAHDPFRITEPETPPEQGPFNVEEEIDHGREE